MHCPVCAAENLESKRFCGDCGASLSLTCSSCGECGAALSRAGGTPVPSPVTAAPLAGPVRATPGGPATTELRHVSVLFCDLVGYTTLSESRDPADVRELLSGYYDLAREIVARYGGAIQKFIGDAVMAVWGAPVAREDDAERAVRAALDLVSAVTAYGNDQGIDLSVRVGV